MTTSHAQHGAIGGLTRAATAATRQEITQAARDAQWQKFLDQVPAGITDQAERQRRARVAAQGAHEAPGAEGVGGPQQGCARSSGRRRRCLIWPHDDGQQRCGGAGRALADAQRLLAEVPRQRLHRALLALVTAE